MKPSGVSPNGFCQLEGPLQYWDHIKVILPYQGHVCTIKGHLASLEDIPFYPTQLFATLTDFQGRS